MATAFIRALTAALVIVATPLQLSAAPAPPVHLTSEQDHNRVLELLHIASLRRGPDGDPASPRAANFDESKVDPNLRLPDPLLLRSGKRVANGAAWWKYRRPEIVAAFDTEIYGRVPKNVPAVAWKVASEIREQAGDVPVVRKEITGHLDNSSYPAIDVNIQLTLVTPANARGPVPIMMELGLSAEAVAALKKRFTPEQWATFQGSGPDWRSQLLARGWGYAVLIPTSIQPDSGEGLTSGVIGLTNKGRPRGRLDEWGALRAWAWGASRAMDYFETDRSVDARQVGIEGLSRYGKAALLAMAYEPRFAIAFVGSSGAGGAKIWRRNFGEQVENIASSSEYHWMAGNFLKYAGPLAANDLPIDSHELIALCAPRPVFVSSGSQQVEGGWVDARGMFLGAVNAGPVYRLLGKKDLGTAEFPPLETALIDGEIAFRQHSGGHTTGPNWPTFLTFATRHIRQGVFESQSDVGSVTPPGTATFNSASDKYTLTAAGANTWYHVDGFHYLWKKSAGDQTLSAEISFPPATYSHTPDPHRKGILMFRQSLDAGGAYVGVAQHGSGLMALQFRRQRGANSEDVELNIDAPKTAQIVKHGDTYTMYVSMKGEPLHPVGASVDLHLDEPFYVGLGAVSHDVNTTDAVEFSHVSLQRTAPAATTARQVEYSTLQTISINDQFRRAMVIRFVAAHTDSPNWAPDGKSIYVHEGGHIQRIPYLDPPAGGPPQVVDVGKLIGCSGNFGLSPDGKWIAVSCSEVSGAPHEVFLLPAMGAGNPRKLTNTTASSYFHAWAPDSQSLAFTQGKAGQADIFSIAIDGSGERRLTKDTLSDGPDYSPDGKYIYFDSSRSGTTQIWRMKPDGSDAEQVTDDEGINHSPHVSPDGKAVAFLNQAGPESNDIVPTKLRVITSGDGQIRTVAHFEGNRGSFQMYGWGDATHLAFISYQKLPEEDHSRQRPAITGVSHIAVYAADPAKSERFYVHDLGAVAAADPESATGHRYYFAPTQFVQVLPLPAGPPSINRLDHVAFTTTDAAQLRKYLASQKIKVPKTVERGEDGSQWFRVTDPEGNQIEFVQPPAALPDMAANPLSSHIIHVGFIVHNRALEDQFFQQALGFRPYWFGGMKDDTPTWISQQVPDGTDWLEYMIAGTADSRGIPPGMSAATAGVLNHFSLGVGSAADAYTLMWNGNRLDGQSNTPKIGRDAKWQLNLLDPDGTRAEVMEFHAIGTPCCSPFTASDPQK